MKLLIDIRENIVYSKDNRIWKKPLCESGFEIMPRCIFRSCLKLGYTLGGFLSSLPPTQGWGRCQKLNVSYFRPRKLGPESVIENTVANQIPHFFASEANTLWAAGSPPIGAGMPDLVAVSYEPQVFALAQVEMPTIHILAYLRTVGGARLETIIGRTGIPQKTILRYLNDLVEVEAVARVDDTYSLLPVWRQILPEIVTIEVKVTNWKRAIDQAARNRIFSHRSFIALPDIVAERIRLEPSLRKLGIGLLSVGDGHTVSVIRHSRYHKPRVWKYYYEIAFLAAKYGKD